MSRQQLNLFPTAREIKAQERLRSVRRHLVNFGPLTIAELALDLHVSRQTVARALKSLMATGKVYPWGVQRFAKKTHRHGASRARLWGVSRPKGRIRLALEVLQRMLLEATGRKPRPTQAPDQ